MTKLTYQDAGVDIDQAEALVKEIKTIARATHRPGVISGIGGFGALFEIPTHFKQPILVSGTDGVGTKLKLAIMLDRHDTIGIDLVAMCVNDIITCGAEPLFFLDYYASGKLNSQQAKTIIEGIGRGCTLAGCALSGGETAEMPGMYHDGDYDLAGFCVGAVEKDQLITGDKVSDGDLLVALGSSGIHANGYSLVRKILEQNTIDLNTPLDQTPLADLLIEPTRIYAKTLLALSQAIDLYACAHITGGGIPGNLPRVLPKGLTADIDYTRAQWPALFSWLADQGNIDEQEMYRTFNCGVGMVLVINPADLEQALTIAKDQGEQAWLLGRVRKQ